MNQRRSAEDLQDDADEDVLIVSDDLRSKLLDDGLPRFDDGPTVMGVLYYEIPSAGIAGRLIGYKRMEGSIQVALQVQLESIKEVFSCPEFVRLVVTIGDEVVHEADFNEPWIELHRELISKDGHLELHISLVEHDT